jgi:hypothetical protein
MSGCRVVRKRGGSFMFDGTIDGSRCHLLSSAICSLLSCDTTLHVRSGMAVR